MSCCARVLWPGARDEVAVIGEAIEAKAAGKGHRRVAARLALPAWRVRRWLRRLAERAVEITGHYTQWAHALDVSLGPVGSSGGAFGDAVEAIGVAARAAVLRLGPHLCRHLRARSGDGRRTLGDLVGRCWRRGQRAPARRAHRHGPKALRPATRLGLPRGCAPIGIPS